MTMRPEFNEVSSLKLSRSKGETRMEPFASFAKCERQGRDTPSPSFAGNLHALFAVRRAAVAAEGWSAEWV